MENFYIYMIQVNIALLVYYLLYRILFVNDTFLEIRRIFLWVALLLAFVYPAISFLAVWKQQEVLRTVMLNYTELLSATASSAVPERETPLLSWQNLLLFIWGAGVFLLLAKMCFQFFVLYRMVSRGKKVSWNGIRLIVPERDIAPFSFFGWIFVDPFRYEDKGLAEIIAHESTHVRRFHSLDVVIGELLTVLFWFNPVVWLFRKEICQNLEFLADRQVIDSGCNRKSYQYHLLRLSCGVFPVKIVNHFNASSLKRRLVMMNKQRTSRFGLLKYVLLVPVTGLLFLSASADTVAEVTEKAVTGFRPAVREVVAEVAEKAETGFKQAAREVKMPDIARDDERIALLKGKVINVKRMPSQGVAVGNLLPGSPQPGLNALSPSRRKAVTPDDGKKMDIDSKDDILYVIDGKKMPANFNLNELSTDDIESITVLKEKGAALRLYGEDRKDGVLIITTKRKK